MAKSRWLVGVLHAAGAISCASPAATGSPATARPDSPVAAELHAHSGTPAGGVHDSDDVLRKGSSDAAASGGLHAESSEGECAVDPPAAFEQLSMNPMLPDPFRGARGTRITTKRQWPCRRAEIRAQVQEYELGPKPGRPASVKAAMEGDQLEVTVSDGPRAISFSASITLPSGGSPPYPAMIGIGRITIGPAELRNLGVATIVFPNDVVAEQHDATSRGRGRFYDLYGADHPAGSMIAWAWGVSRLIDALEQTPAARIDTARLGVTGCSRNGKGALIAGAFDDRIALTIPQESGSGGTASWRVSDAQLAAGGHVQTLSEITGENTWFRASFGRFGQAAARLPYDHHMVEGLIAPRALLVVENTSQEWLGNVSTYTGSMAAHLIWEALGVPDRMGVSQTGDHTHCAWNGSQQQEVTAFVEKFLIGAGQADTHVAKTDGSYSFDRSKWIDWTVPTLQ